MGANAQTSVPTFTAGEVLTAANMNISARTGVPVFADTTARDAGFGGTGEKTLAEGQLCYLESTNVVQYYDGASWATVGPAAESGLTLISSTTIGSAVSSVTVSDAFSATYDNYLIIVSGGVASTGNQLNLTLGSTTTGYYYAGSYVQYGSNTVTGEQATNAANWPRTVIGTTNSLNGYIDLFNPFQSKNTHVMYRVVSSATNGFYFHNAGYLADTTSYTAFTMTTSTGTVTGGTIKLYGYKN